jgi:predicted RNA-binding Zn-ribbon protein involved in translation (DUF1610 family)
MTCLICDEPAVAIDADDDYLERTCPKCGHYRITGAALVLMKAHSWRFDVELTRKWIAEHQGTGAIPIIDSHQAARLIDV